MTNVAGQRAYASVQRELTDTLLDRLIETSDVTPRRWDSRVMPYLDDLWNSGKS